MCEIFFAVSFECNLFHAKLLGRFFGVTSNVTTFRTSKIVPPSLSNVYSTLRDVTDRRGQEAGSLPPNENALNDKNIKTESTVSLVSFSISPYKSARDEL